MRISIAESNVNLYLAWGPDLAGSYRYQILSDGTGQMITYFPSEQKTKTLKIYSESELAHIVNQVTLIQAGNFINPKQAPCIEGSYSSRHSVFNGEGKIQIFKEQDCKRWSRENAGDADEEMIKVLSALENLGTKD